MSKLEESIEKVDAKCDRIETNVAVIASKLEDQARTLRENTDSLKDHVMRTNTLQNMVVSLQDIVTSMNKRLEPIEQERLKQQAVSDFLKSKAAKWVKICGAAAGIITVVYYIIKIKSGV